MGGSNKNMIDIDKLIEDKKKNALFKAQDFEDKTAVLLEKIGCSAYKKNKDHRSLKNKLKKISERCPEYYDKYTEEYKIDIRSLMRVSNRLKTSLGHSNNYQLKEIIRTTDFLKKFYKRNRVKRIDLSGVFGGTSVDIDKFIELVDLATKEDEFDIQNYLPGGNHFGYSLNSLACGYYDVAFIVLEISCDIIEKIIIAKN